MADSFTLKINKEDAAFLPYLTELQYTESLDALDALLVEFQLDHPGEVTTLMGKVAAGAPYELTVGSRTFKGDLTQVRCTGDGGLWRINAVGLEQLARLRHQRMASVLEMTKDKVAAELIAASGMTAKATGVSSTAEEAVVLDEPMLIALKQIAAATNYAWHTDGANLVFAPRSVAAGSALSLTWQKDLLGLTVTHDVSDVLTAVTVNGRDYRLEEDAVTYAASETDLKKISGGKSAIAVRKASMGAVEVVLSAGGRTGTATEAKELAVALIQQGAERFATGELRCTLLPAAVCGQKVSLSGAPTQLAGPFLVQSVTHVLSPPAARETRLGVFSDGLPA